MPNLCTDCTTDNWRARRRRLWIATMSVRLLTVTNGMMKLASVDIVSRFMKSSKAFSRSFVISSLWSSVTGSPIDFITFPRLTRSPRSCAEGKSPAQKIRYPPIVNLNKKKFSFFIFVGDNINHSPKVLLNIMKHTKRCIQLIVHTNWTNHLFGHWRRFDRQEIESSFEIVLWKSFEMQT